jgi:hypothetical protein
MTVNLSVKPGQSFETIRQHGIDKGARRAVNASESDAVRVVYDGIGKVTDDRLF